MPRKRDRFWRTLHAPRAPPASPASPASPATPEPDVALAVAPTTPAQSAAADSSAVVSVAGPLYSRPGLVDGGSCNDPVLRMAVSLVRAKDLHPRPSPEDEEAFYLLRSQESARAIALNYNQGVRVAPFIHYTFLQYEGCRCVGRGGLVTPKGMVPVLTVNRSDVVVFNAAIALDKKADAAIRLPAAEKSRCFELLRSFGLDRKALDGIYQEQSPGEGGIVSNFNQTTFHQTVVWGGAP